MKKILFLAIVIFVLSISGFSYAADEFYKGSVIMISGHKITIKTDEGKVVTVRGNAKKLNIGDKVTVNNGTVIREGGMPDPQPQVKPANSKSPDTKK